MNKAIVIGFGGKSGVASMNLLLDKGYTVTANDIKKEQELGEFIEQITNKDKVKFVFGHHKVDILNDINLIVISPGVPSNIEIIELAKKKNIPVISEVELAFQEHPANWVGITGTDGKSTTTCLIGNVLKLKYSDVIVGGNLGTPLTEMVKRVRGDAFVVAELSSFQLENILHLKPLIGVLVNIAQDHLDRYDSFKDYIKAKFNLFKNQTEIDFSVFNYENEIISDWLNKTDIPSKKYYFSLNNRIKTGTFYENKEFIWQDENHQEPVFQDGQQQIIGEHNKENILAAISVAKLLKIENEYIQEGIKNFKGLPHRMELAKELEGRYFYNDSKATTPSAVKKSISSFNDIILIMGGKDKGLDFSLLNEELNKRVKNLILVGEAKEKIRTMITYPQDKILLLDDFKQAVLKAYNLSKQGDNIILSPGCASFDMFKNFEDRGEVFKNIVNQIS